METTKVITKDYKGYTFIFRYDAGRGYRVSAKWFNPYWYQSTTSVREAFKKIKNG